MSESRSQNLLGALARAAVQGVKDANGAFKGAKPPSVGAGETRFVPPERTQAEAEKESAQGWGFDDTKFVVKPNGSVVLTGTRYNISNVELPHLLPWMAKQIASPLAYENTHPSQFPPAVPTPRAAPALVAELRKFLAEDQISVEPLERMRRGHGHTGAEIWKIRYERLERVPDLIVYPASHAEVVNIVEAAKAHGACIIPFGGGTNVTDALTCDPGEGRPILSLDMRRMNRILWIDPVNLTACIEAGARGREIVEELTKYRLTIGHEPDSIEFSTLGGWIATNASGMKKNRYGNIEDIVLDVQVVTAQGVIERPQVGPRESIGMNPKNMMFGSEGNLGVITSAIVKLFPMPEVRRYGSVVFPDLKNGFDFLYDLQRSGVVPASVRLVDNTQFHFGQALKPKTEGLYAAKSWAQSALVTRVKGFDPKQLSVATIVYEGTREEVDFQESVLRRLAKRRGGLLAGAANGERGYQLTFGIAYIRDLTFDHWVIAESFETSVPWSRALELYERVQRRVTREHEERGLPGRVFFTGRFTQIYPTGVCVYFYMGFYAKGVADPIGQYTAMEHAAREEILAAGGSLSHHHGVGKLRQDFMKNVYSEAALSVISDVKRAVDPHNLFGARNHGVPGAREATRAGDV